MDAALNTVYSGRTGMTAGKGRAKLLLFGEHAAVYGHPAVGVPLPLETVVFIPDGGRDDDSRCETFRELPPDFIRAVFKKWPRFDGKIAENVRIISAIPRDRGFGSSAALSVAFVRFIEALLGQHAVDRTVWEEAHSLERVFHGTPSGIDTGLSLADSPRFFSFGAGALPEQAHLPPLPCRLVFGSIPREESTKSLVGKIAERASRNERAVLDGIRRIGGLTRRAADLLAAANNRKLDEFAHLVNSCQEELRRLDLSSPRMDELLLEGIRAGAPAGKLSGAGKGGAFYFPAEDAVTAAQITAAVSAFCRTRYAAGEWFLSTLL